MGRTSFCFGSSYGQDCAVDISQGDAIIGINIIVITTTSIVTAYVDAIIITIIIIIIMCITITSIVTNNYDIIIIIDITIIFFNINSPSPLPLSLLRTILSIIHYYYPLISKAERVTKSNIHIITRDAYVIF